MKKWFILLAIIGLSGCSEGKKVFSFDSSNDSALIPYGKELEFPPNFLKGRKPNTNSELKGGYNDDTSAADSAIIKEIRKKAAI